MTDPANFMRTDREYIKYSDPEWHFYYKSLEVEEGSDGNKNFQGIDFTDPKARELNAPVAINEITTEFRQKIKDDKRN